jgi:tetratricopeptide (TPR) repeat protein
MFRDNRAGNSIIMGFPLYYICEKKRGYMNNANLKKLMDKAGKMALLNIWGENAYKINMAILKADHNNSAACTRLAKYYKLNNNIPKAKKMYLKALKINPNNRGAINNLYDIEKSVIGK